MNCIYCKKPVHGSDGISIQHVGPAHKICFEVHKATRREFQSIVISDLTDEKLTDLHDMVLTEINERNKGSDDDIELF